MGLTQTVEPDEHVELDTLGLEVPCNGTHRMDRGFGVEDHLDTTRPGSRNRPECADASGYVDDHPPETVLNLPEGSWGAGGTHFVWDNTDTHWMWPIIHAAERRMVERVGRATRPTDGERTVLNQAARELLLLVERMGRLQELVLIGQKRRPNLAW